MRTIIDKIIITELAAIGIVGVEHPERDFPQELIINAEIYYDLSKIEKSDDIQDGISYSYIAKLIRQLVSESSFFTLEALGAFLIGQVFINTSAQAVKLRIEKEKFVKKTRRVGIEIYRERPL